MELISIIKNRDNNKTKNKQNRCNMRKKNKQVKQRQQDKEELMQMFTDLEIKRQGRFNSLMKLRMFPWGRSKREATKAEARLGRNLFQRNPF